MFLEAKPNCTEYFNLDKCPGEESTRNTVLDHLSSLFAHNKMEKAYVQCGPAQGVPQSSHVHQCHWVALCDNVPLSPLSPISFPGRCRHSLLRAGLLRVLTEKNIHLIKYNSSDTCVINMISIAALRKQAESRDCLVEVDTPRR